jgi:hypothetical protein
LAFELTTELAAPDKLRQDLDNAKTIQEKRIISIFAEFVYKKLEVRPEKQKEAKSAFTTMYLANWEVARELKQIPREISVNNLKKVIKKLEGKSGLCKMNSIPGMEKTKSDELVEKGACMEQFEVDVTEISQSDC